MFKPHSNKTIVWEVIDHGSSLKLKKCSSFGIKGREYHIQKLCQFKYNGDEYIMAGRKGLSIDIYKVEESFITTCKNKQLITSQGPSDFFISLEILENKSFRACTGLGYCYFLDLDTLMNSSYQKFSMSFGLHGSIGFFKFINNSEIIIGGKDREINIIELENHSNVWKSKTVKKLDKELNMTTKEPTWIQDVVLVDNGNTGFKIIAGTRFGKLLFYDPSLSKFPLDELQISEYPIKHLKLLDKSTLLIANSFNEVTIFDFKKQEIINRMELPTGALSTMSTMNITDGVDSIAKSLVLIMSNLDKCLRLYLFEDGSKTLLTALPNVAKISEVLLLDVDKRPVMLKNRCSSKRLRTR